MLCRHYLSQLSTFTRVLMTITLTIKHSRPGHIPFTSISSQSPAYNASPSFQGTSPAPRHRDEPPTKRRRVDTRRPLKVCISEQIVPHVSKQIAKLPAGAYERNKIAEQVKSQRPTLPLFILANGVCKGDTCYSEVSRIQDSIR